MTDWLTPFRVMIQRLTGVFIWITGSNTALPGRFGRPPRPIPTVLAPPMAGETSEIRIDTRCTPVRQR
ncbi:hypothetical protein CHT98_17230 (plasmid) [Azospirillum brasilense]|uniref:Uncharacterized protein n=1 Tax=Azospirillum brasilense TaxID=192 RepID=A0A235HBH0_AZOBR|nr:hypothetical protein CHT98_17230 [Azospirillum brasilense]